MNSLKTVLRETDFTLLLLCVATSVFGILMVSSATAVDVEEGARISRDTLAMILAVSAGLVFSIVISFIDYNIVPKLYPAIAGACLLLMAATLVFGVGPEERQDAKTWLALGNTGLYFQPSELLKIGFLITYGVHIEKVQDRITEFRTIIMLAVHALIPIGLVVISGDMGSALVFVLMFAASYIGSRMKKR